ncbi:glycosyltransferase [Clostridium tagluense]|uniref:glycosyltransferase n=1 Tax=Clostridium tagluense TaxID=360422 RepID=UPI001CF142C8|nr:glycosyltransferase [Clostridium tagluense]MCB2296303.1 glycosyltransferase [Clostridium tagluense]
MKENLPLVSILIPTYNQTKYLEKALISALNQTYTNIEIIICDDSTNDEVEKMINHYMVNHKNIKYYNNGGPLGQRGLLNGEKCFNLSNGEYINYLFHDDVFYRNKIEVMVNYFMCNKDVTLVTSYRNHINKNDELVYIPKKILPKTTKITGESLGAFMLHTMANIVGEPTTAMFKKTDIKDAIFSYKGRKSRSYVDMAIWFNLLLKGNAIYIAEPLSSFRIHDTQNTQNPLVHILGAIDCYYFLTDSYLDKDFLKSKEEYLKLIKRWLNFYIGKIKELENYIPKDDNELKELSDIKKDLYYCYAQSIKCLISL